MKKIVLVVIILAVGVFAFFYLGYASYFAKIDFDKVKSCEQDSDCIVKNADCCGCNANGHGIIINKKYEEEWDNYLKLYCMNGRPNICQAAMSRDPECVTRSFACVNNVCTVKEKN